MMLQLLNTKNPQNSIFGVRLFDVSSLSDLSKELAARGFSQSADIARTVFEMKGK